MTIHITGLPWIRNADFALTDNKGSVTSSLLAPAGPFFAPFPLVGAFLGGPPLYKCSYLSKIMLAKSQIHYCD